MYLNLSTIVAVYNTCIEGKKPTPTDTNNNSKGVVRITKQPRSQRKLIIREGYRWLSHQGTSLP